ncbi:hypothetical protein [Paenibacillus andongensis]|nr:hypothetical protein [Paenibacillus andongensis]
MEITKRGVTTGAAAAKHDHPTLFGVQAPDGVRGLNGTVRHNAK